MHNGVQISFLFAVIVGAGFTNAAAEEPNLTADDIQTILRRLDSAEKTIGSLQSELRDVKQKQANSSPIRSYPVESDSAPQPMAESPTNRAPLNRNPFFPERYADTYEVKAEPGIPDANLDGVDIRELLSGHSKRWDEQDVYNKNFSSDLKKAVRPGTSLGTMKIIGRVHIDQWAFPGDSPGVNAFETGNSRMSPQDRIGFRRMRFGVRGDVWENMEYRVELELAGGNRTEFRDAWLGFKHLPFLQTLLIGNQKRPYGLDHLNSSRYNVFMERPFVIESFNQDARRLGIASYGVSDNEAYNWRFGIYNQRLIQDEGNYVSDQYQGEIAGRFANTIWYDECSDGRGYAHWAISGTYARPDGSTPNDNGSIGRDANEARFRHRPEARSASRWLDTGRIAGAKSYRIIGLEGVVNVGAFQVVGEYQNLQLTRDAGFGPDVTLYGGYAYVSYFLTGEHIPWNRRTGTLGRVKPFENFFMVKTADGGTATGWGAWQVALRYSYADFTDQNIFGGVGESLTFGLNWHWNPNARMQFNYIHGQISDRNVTDSNGLTFTGGEYDIIGTRLMIDF